MALTGLQWSYEWYRDGLYAMAGVERRAEGGPRREGGPREPRNAGDGGVAQSPDLTRAWQAFVQASPGYATVNINLGGAPGQPIEFRYLEPKGAHERAYNTMAIDVETGAIRRQERYAEKTRGGRLVSSIFPLHSGSYFGTVGVVLFLIASLAMPVFAVTGWMMYLQRRRKRASEPAPVMSAANP
jgi:sulfite reductase (NADPH) flavoprotein alpha-component